MKDSETKEYEEYVKRAKERDASVFIVSIVILGMMYFFGEDSSIGNILLGIGGLLFSRGLQQENEDGKKWRNDSFFVKCVDDFLLGTIAGIALKLGGIFMILRGIYLFFA